MSQFRMLYAQKTLFGSVSHSVVADLSEETSPGGESHISCVNQESCDANTILPITYAMSDGGVSGLSDKDFQSQRAHMIPILTNNFRCLICSLSAVNIWSPPPPRCPMCTSDILTCAPAIEDTDNEEDADGEHVVFQKQNKHVISRPMRCHLGIF